MQGSVGILAAFAAGVVSFLSPCVLPLIPGYLSFITGYTPSELSDSTASRRAILMPSILFVLGFTFVFVAMGASASILGSVLMDYREVLVKLSGGFVFLLGFFMLGIVKVPWLYGEARFDMGKTKGFGRAAALITGMAFAFGWTPCVGPILGSILALAGTSGSVGNGVVLLLAYSLGLGVPFILTAVFLGRLTGVLSWLNRHALIVNRVAGVLLMGVGLMIVTGQLSRLGGWLTSVLPTIEP